MTTGRGPVCWQCLHWWGRYDINYDRTMSDGWCMLHNKATLETDTCASWEAMGPEPEPEGVQDDDR